MLVLIVLLIGITMLSLLIGLLARSSSVTVHERLAQVADKRPRLGVGQAVQQELSLPLVERMLRPWVKNVAGAVSGATPSGALDQIRKKLDRAGYPAGLTTESFVALRGLTLVIGSAGGIYGALAWHSTLINRLTVLMALVTAAACLPHYLLENHIRSRQYKIRRALPDVMDLLVVCTEAGVGLDTALQEVINRHKGPLVFEFQRLLSEVRLGKPRSQAWEDLAERTGVEEVRLLVSSLLQAEQLGMSIANTLRTQAQALRTKRSMRVRIVAASMAVKMLFPMIFCIFPALLAVVLGPAVVSIAASFHMFGQ